MAHLWFRDEDGVWGVMPMNGRAVDVSVYPPRLLAEGFRIVEGAPSAVIGVGAGAVPVWVLMVGGTGDVRVNGFPPVAGMRVLQDRDEIRAAVGDPLFFSTETLAHVEEFPGSERTVYCGRCRQAMVKGQMAVRCPNGQCAIWYHQTEQLPCWTYTPTCAFCPQSTSLDAGFTWTPEA
jgi:hypothetical protein